MKKILFGMMACAALCACTSDDLLSVANQAVNSGDGVATYMTVRIKDVNSGTRATAGGFAYGTADEQTVNNAYFYLYDKDGNYVAYGSLGEVSGEAKSETTPGNIEWNSSTQVAIYGLTDPSVPTKMLTVLNQPSGINLERQSFDAAVETLAGTPWGNTTDGFVMSTSVYESGTSVMNYTELKESDFALEPINIEEDYGTDNSPVDVYVERLAAKVGVADGMTSSLESNGHVYALSEEELANFPMGAPVASNSAVGGIAIEILGFDVDGVARDAYVSKKIDTQWSLGTWTWNAASSFRSYWAESPNYDDKETVYPTSSKGNTATDENEASTWLNPYLRYVDLQSPVEIGSTTYCGENTNTTDVIGNEDTDPSMNSLTNVIVKAQLIDYNPNATGDNAKKPIDIVEYHGEYYTAADFCQKCVDDVVNYDFTVLVDEVIAALKAKYTGLGTYLDDLNDAIIHDHIYKSETAQGGTHKFSGTSADTDPTSVTAFGGEMLSLYNAYDGNVRIFYNGAQPYYGESGDDTGTAVEKELYEKYPEENIVYGGADLDKYDFWFHVDNEKFKELELGALTVAGLVKQIGDEYYMPIDNSISFTTSATGDPNYSGGHTYTTRNFLLRAITVEADGIDTEFGSLYPNYFKDGLMYYHVPIEHLNTTTGDDIVEGEYGVVRNHWYNVTITSLEGLGRGIAVEDEVIVPQPDVDYYYLGADIDILSWQMVNQSVAW